MKLRRLMPIASRGQSLPKGSVVRHSKIAPRMTLWVKNGADIGRMRQPMFALPRNRTWGLLPSPILSECRHSVVPLLCKNSF